MEAHRHRDSQAVLRDGGRHVGQVGALDHCLGRLFDIRIAGIAFNAPAADAAIRQHGKLLRHDSRTSRMADNGPRYIASELAEKVRSQFLPLPERHDAAPPSPQFVATPTALVESNGSLLLSVHGKSEDIGPGIMPAGVKLPPRDTRGRHVDLGEQQALRPAHRPCDDAAEGFVDDGVARVDPPVLIRKSASRYGTSSGMTDASNAVAHPTTQQPPSRAMCCIVASQVPPLSQDGAT